MANIVISANGNGSNFENTIQEINSGHVNNATCKVLIIDKEHAYAKERAEELHIPCVYVNPKAYADKELYEQRTLSILKEHQVELIVLTGHMHFIGKALLEGFPGHIINLHPAYPPNFSGAHSTQDVYEARVDFTGVTVHFIDEGMDTGEIIYQEKITIDFTWSLETLEEHMHVLEYNMFPKVIKHVCKMVESGGAQWSGH